MNKKIVGFVLAMCLVVGLGSSSFARVEFEAGAGLSQGSDGVVMTIDYESDMKKFAESKKGDLETFFGYAAGTMTYAASKTSLSFYDAYGLKVSYGVTGDEKTATKNSDGTVQQYTKYNYTVQSLNLNASDYDKIQKEYGGDLKRYLVEGLGVNEKALKTNKGDGKGGILKYVYETDENGKLKKDANGKYILKKDKNGKPIESVDGNGNTVMEDAAWLQDASKWLEGGINFSVSLSLGGNDPTVTLSENGKANATLGTYYTTETVNGKEVAKKTTYVATSYQYSSNGFLMQTKNAELVDTSTSDKKAKYELQYSITVMNAKGQQSYTYKVDKNGKAQNYTKKTMSVKDNKVTYTEDKDSSGNKVTASGHTADFYYSANGSLSKVTDNTTGNTTHYVAGRPSYVTNKEGGMISQNTYVNGILQKSQTFNNGTVVNTTVFDAFGRELGTVNGNVGYNKAVAAIIDVRDTGVVKNDCIVQSYKVYNDMTAPLTGFKGNTYGYTTAIKDVAVTTGDDKANVEKSLSGDHYFIKENGKWKQVSKSEYESSSASSSSKRTVKITSHDGIAIMSDDDANFLCNNFGIAKSKKQKLGEISIGGKKKYANHEDKDMVTFSIKDSSDAKKLFGAFGIEVDDSAKANVAKANDGSSIKGQWLGKSYVVNTHKAATLTVTTFSQGVRIKQTTVNAKNDSNKSTLVSYNKMDPAVVGTVKEIVTVDGKQYAVLTDAQVDLEDGEGFKSADGEEIYVCIDGLSDEEKANLKEGSTFAAAGYIDTTVDGKMAINNLYAKEVGGSNVDNMVQSFSATLAGNAEYKANVQLNMLTFAKAAADGKTYNDVKGGWKLLLEYGGGAPAIF